MSHDAVYLRHILDAAEKIASYTNVGLEAFMSTSHWQDAVIRQLEIIGEATKGITKKTRDEHPEIPWRRMAGLRDVLIHDYMGVDLHAVWVVTQQELPILRTEITRILRELDRPVT